MSAGVDLRKLALVARFELAEALRSRLVVVVLALYGAGAGLGAYIFSRTLEVAEERVREALLAGGGAQAVPDDLVRQQALPRVIAFLVADPALQRELLDVEPLALFYGFMALALVAPVVLLTSGGAHASEIASGGSRFVLTRVDRLSWSLGKLAGHALLLLVGLLVGALATALVAQLGRGIDMGSVLWLVRASLRAWVYGLAYLGIFSCVALLVRAPSGARAVSVALLFLLWIMRSVCKSSLVAARFPLLGQLVWLFPAEHELGLWSPRWLESLAASGALLGIGAGAFGLGYARFRRGDA
ncbi:MAG TPA: ABC transporter permease subunit [Polyangiaceae bacterium]|nr:ABC transporter permease subunit [Polyangiaceae bacterium]